MPKRFQSNQYKAIYPLIAERDGNYCLACRVETGRKRGPQSCKLELDHADGDRSNWSPRNLHILCKTHNLKFRSLTAIEHVALIARYSAENKRIRMRAGEFLSESKASGVYLIGSPEMQVNSRAEAMWLDFMKEEIDTNGSISKDDAVYAGCIEADDVNPQTTERYWKKHTSRKGRFQEVRRDGIKYAVYRDEGKDGKKAGH